MVKGNTNVNGTQEKNEVVVISGKEVSRIDYKGEPVVTFRMIDELHERPEGTAGRNFRENKDRFIENEDFFEVPYEEWSEMIARRNSSGDQDKQRNPIKFMTKTGYLMLVKSFKDDLAWKVQRELVKAYFAVRSSNAGDTGRYAGLFEYVEYAEKSAKKMGVIPEKRPFFINEMVIGRYGVDFHAKYGVTPENVTIPKQRQTLSNLEIRLENNKDNWMKIVRYWWAKRGGEPTKVSDVMVMIAQNRLHTVLYGKNDISRRTALGKMLTKLSETTFPVTDSKQVSLQLAGTVCNAKIWQLMEVSNVR